MSCSFGEDLTAYIDGELPEVRGHAVKLHLEGCGECRTIESLLRSTMRSLEAAPRFEPSADVRRRVLESIAEQTSLWSQLKVLLTPKLWVPVAGLMMVLAVVFAVTTRGEELPPFEAPGQVELAANLEELEDLDVAGLEEVDDLDVILALDELDERAKGDSP